MAEDEILKDNIIRSFGKESYTNGRLNRDYLSEQVFSNPARTALLNSIVHPATIKDAEEWMKRQDSPYLIKEAALIFESGSNRLLDKVIGVSSPLSMRMERIMKRSHISAEQVKARINLQMDEEQKMALCDYIIVNDEKQMLIPQVLLLHEKFLSLAG